LLNGNCWKCKMVSSLVNLLAAVLLSRKSTECRIAQLAGIQTYPSPPVWGLGVVLTFPPGLSLPQLRGEHGPKTGRSAVEESVFYSTLREMEQHSV
jgi:hypothetical protein